VRHFTLPVAQDFSYDLHVLGTPPAFVLSQDQTLQLLFENDPFFKENEQRPKNSNPYSFVKEQIYPNLININQINQIVKK
jgi:hypothetical protein